MNDLVRRLLQGNHPVEVSLRPERTVEGLKAAIDRGYVHIKFTGTRGGTELGFTIDNDLSILSTGDFNAKTGLIKLCGDLTLDYERVRCIAEIGLETLQGQGHLELLAGEIDNRIQRAKLEG